jgi:hypothetical protein
MHHFQNQLKTEVGDGTLFFISAILQIYEDKLASSNRRNKYLKMNAVGLTKKITDS